MSNIESMDKLINSFTMLQGVGKKTAERYAYNVIDMTDEQVEFFAKSLQEAKANIHYCSVCGNFTEKDVCEVCSSRKSDTICVVKEPKDVIALEKVRKQNFVYHVLHGTISPLEGKGPDDIRIKELMARLNDGNFKEVILCTNPDVEGEVTANYIAKLIKPFGIKVTRLATGIQMGSDLQYADEVTLTKAIEDRKTI
ncbi:MAG: recombination protein RecR [Clostridia bacterium]|nr:recombination protein RecR [Clostridia bacterium]